MQVKPCRSVDAYQKLNRIEEGTYGVVYRARDKETGEIVALKRLKLEKERDGFPVTSLREINALMTLRHPNIVNIREVVVGEQLSYVFLVLDFIEHDLRSLMDDLPQPFHLSEVKTLLRQLLSAVDAMHSRWIIHRDLKTSNLLLSNRGEIKVADFGLARRIGDPPDLRSGRLTPVVVTLWYRAPEVLFGSSEYSWPIDLWSVGCIFAELLTGKPLFPGRSDIDQIDRIIKVLGCPSEEVWPGYHKLPHASKISPGGANQTNILDKLFPSLSPVGISLMNGLLTYNPKSRLTAEQALAHPFFSEAPLPKASDLFPTWPSRSAGEKRPRSTPEAPKMHHE